MNDAGDALRALAATPKRITELSRERDDDVLGARPSADEWSATEILAHLRACADVWGSSIQRMIDEDHPTIRYVSPRSVMRKPEYRDRGFAESLALFVAARKALVKTLKALPAKGWAGGATIKAATKNQESSVLDYARNIATHEAVHIAQLEALLS